MGCIDTKKIVLSNSNISKIKLPNLEKKISMSRTSSNSKNGITDFKKIATGEKIKIKNIIYKSETRIEENYKILNQLGKGSFGSVFKVLHIESGLIRAMKIIKKESLNYQDDDQKFLKEIEILIGTDHPNIMKIYEYYTDETNYYLITEFLSGGELYDTISNWNYFDEEKAGYILIQILSAVNYLHSLKIVHRDIKPENMLVENKLKSDKNDELINIKLIDFGTCNYYEGNKSLTLRVGSPYYIAPEVIKRKYNEKCDIWSCGVILFIMLVGHPPFSGSTTSELLENVAKGKYSMKNSCWNNVSDQAKDLLKKMLEFEPNKRISAQEAIEHPWITKIQHKQITNIDKDYFSSVLKNIKNFNAKEKLQQATIAYIVHFIYSSQEIEGLKKVFKFLDKNGDGRLTYGELRSGFDRVFGRYLSDLEMNKVIEEVDGDNDGYISYEEFLRVAINRKKLLEEKNLKLAFDRFDLNKDGNLSKDEVKKVLGTQENQYINLLLHHIDKNKDGFISFSEFCNLMSGVVNTTINYQKENDDTASVYGKFQIKENNHQSHDDLNLLDDKKMNKENNQNEIFQDIDKISIKNTNEKNIENLLKSQYQEANTKEYGKIKETNIDNKKSLNMDINTNNAASANIFKVNSTHYPLNINNIISDEEILGNKSNENLILNKNINMNSNLNTDYDNLCKTSKEKKNFYSLSIEDNIINRNFNSNNGLKEVFVKKNTFQLKKSVIREENLLESQNFFDFKKKHQIYPKENKDNIDTIIKNKEKPEKEIISNSNEIFDLEKKIQKHKLDCSQSFQNKNNSYEINDLNYQNLSLNDKNIKKSSELIRHNEIFKNHFSSDESSEAN